MPTKKQTDEQIVPGDDDEQTAIPAAADGSEHKAVGDGTGKALPPITPDSDEHVFVTGPTIVVRAVASFHDQETKRDYKAGDVVPWDLERAAHYAARGLVVIDGQEG